MKFLVIQTAFIGDVILATPVLEKLHRFYPEAQIDIIVRKGNETLLTGHPFLKNIFVWNKKESKIFNLFRLISKIRKEKYDYIINLHRFFTSGLVTVLSGGRHTIGFNKNPLSFLFNEVVKHQINIKLHLHETERNLLLIQFLTDKSTEKPRLYPSVSDYTTISSLAKGNYICIAPASVWHTKQLPEQKWIALIDKLKQQSKELTIYLIGAGSDTALCDNIISHVKDEVINLSGKLTMLQSAALMKNASMNYVNDSAPLHMASAMNANVTVFYCSTVPAFGFGPLSDNSRIVETQIPLECKPCGLHGYRKCPLGHFKCATTIEINF